MTSAKLTAAVVAVGVVGVVAVVAIALRRRGRDTFVSGTTMGFKRVPGVRAPAMDNQTHDAVADVARSVQGLGCALLESLAQRVRAAVASGKGRLPCGVVTDELKKFENSLDAALDSLARSPYAATPRTTAALSTFKADALGVFRAVFDPLCSQDGTFDPAALQKALADAQAAYCGALPKAPARGKPVGGKATPRPTRPTKPTKPGKPGKATPRPPRPLRAVKATPRPAKAVAKAAAKPPGRV